MSRWCVLIVCAGFFGLVSPVSAQDVTGDVVGGRELATQECSECHSVSTGQRPRRLGEAPGFNEIAEKSQTTAISLRAFLQTPHPTMPNLVLTETERDDIIAYILSLKQRSH